MTKYLMLPILTLLISSTAVFAQIPTQTAVFTLTWNDTNSGASQEEGTDIERATSPTGTFVNVGKVGPDVVTYVDTILNDPGNVQQCYRVKAFNSVGSATSNVACGTTPIVKISPTPVNVSVTVSVTVTTP